MTSPAVNVPVSVAAAVVVVTFTFVAVCAEATQAGALPNAVPKLTWQTVPETDPTVSCPPVSFPAIDGAEVPHVEDPASVVGAVPVPRKWFAVALPVRVSEVPVAAPRAGAVNENDVACAERRCHEVAIGSARSCRHAT